MKTRNPTRINFVNGTSIQYLYNATGQKVRKKVSQLDVTDTDYMGGFQYVAGKLSFFPHAEGYVDITVGRKGTTVYNYVYQYKDHLGNIRLSYTFLEEQLYDPGQPIQFQILEENHYYPFGLKHTNYNTNHYEFVEVENGNDYYINVEQLPAGGVSNYKYKYNGKEYQDELGLNMYDYGFRNYEPTLGRWMNIDPLAEKYRRWSSYNYCVNNPVRFIDPDGREIINNANGVTFTGEDAKIAFISIRDEIEETGGLKVHWVEQSKTPNIYKHTLNSFRSGKPSKLHYDSDKSRRDERRKNNFKKSGLGTLKGFHRDEYPYASTFEGSNADVAYVPASENLSQGGSLGALYKTLEHGESFLVIPVPIEREPDAVPEVIKEPSSVVNSIPLPSSENVKKIAPTAAVGVAIIVLFAILLSPIGI